MQNNPHIQAKCEEYFALVLLVPHNIAMGLNNVMEVMHKRMPCLILQERFLTNQIHMEHE